jgi:hypothetical protein
VELRLSEKLFFGRGCMKPRPKFCSFCCGKEPKPLPEKFPECYAAWCEGQMSAAQAAESCGLSRKSFYRAVKQSKQAADCEA